MNEIDQFGTFYKIKLLYKSDRVLNIEKQLEYHLSKHPSNFRYSLYKFVDNQLVYSSGDRSKRMVRNIYHIIQNIEKLSAGKIKRYQIFSQLELEILCHFLKSKSILHTIFLTHNDNKIFNILHDEYVKKSSRYNMYFNKNGLDYEHNKILNCYQLYIQVYNGFVNLLNYDKNSVEKPKYKVYIWPR